VKVDGLNSKADVYGNDIRNTHSRQADVSFWDEDAITH